MISDTVDWFDSTSFSHLVLDHKVATSVIVIFAVVHFLIKDFSWILGLSRVSFYHASNDVRLNLKNGHRKSLSAICKQSIPRCHLNPLLFNGHLQTLWAAVPHDGPPLDYKRKVFDAKDETYIGSFAVDFVAHSGSKADGTLPLRTTYFSNEELNNMSSNDSRPMLVALHGLSGGSNEVYLRRVLAPLTKKHGWEACVVNSRGCAMSQVTSGVLYNARATWDMRQTVTWLRETFPNRPLFGIGFSIGANILTNYIGEEGKKCELKAALVCSNPWNLDTCAKALQRSQIGLEIYSRAMCQSMKSLVIRHENELCKETDIDTNELERIKYLHEFDRVVQCPTWGYPTEDAYYRDASSVDSLLAVNIPLVAIHAENDPICPDEAVPYLAFEKNPYTVLVTTSSGGHLGWYQYNGQQWFAKAAVNSLKNIAQEIRFGAVEARSSLEGTEDTFDPMRRRFHVNLSSQEG